MEINGLNLTITIGAFEVFRAPRWSIESLRHYPLGRACITLSDPLGDVYRTVRQGDAVSIVAGYRDRAPATWTGTVLARCPGETPDQIDIHAVDGALPLSTTPIIQSWEDETPEAIVTWAIRQAGLAVGTIEPTGIVIPRVVASNIMVWQLARQIQGSCRSFGLDMDGWALWLGSAGVNWGTGDEPGDTVRVATTENLIEHHPTDWRSGMGMIETYLAPDLMHSRMVHLVDDRRGIDATHRALRVRHEGTPERIRTFIWYGVEHG